MSTHNKWDDNFIAEKLFTTANNIRQVFVMTWLTWYIDNFSKSQLLTNITFSSNCLYEKTFLQDLFKNYIPVFHILLTYLAQGTFTIHYLSIYHSRLSISRKFGLIRFFFPFKNNMLWPMCQFTSDFSVKKSSNAMPKHAFVCRKEEEKLINYM